jgi:hypothetical protein
MYAHFYRWNRWLVELRMPADRHLMVHAWPWPTVSYWRVKA